MKKLTFEVKLFYTFHKTYWSHNRYWIIYLPQFKSHGIALHCVASQLIASYRIMNFRNSLSLYQLWYFSLDLNKIVNIAAINHSTVILRWTWWAQQHEKSPKNLPKKNIFEKRGRIFQENMHPPWITNQSLESSSL